MTDFGFGTFIDSCILLDIFTSDPKWMEWSLQQVKKAYAKGPLIINPIVYSEISIGFSEIEILEKTLKSLDIFIEPIPHSAAFLTGKAYKAYRSRGGTKKAPLPDFYIGAHAAVLGIPLITRDPRRMKQIYPNLQIIKP